MIFFSALIAFFSGCLAGVGADSIDSGNWNH